VTALAWHKNRRMASGGKDFSVKLYEFHPGTKDIYYRSNESVTTPVTDLAFNANGNLLAVFGSKNRIKLIDVMSSATPIHNTIVGDDDIFTSGGFQEGSNTLIAGSIRDDTRGAIKKWDLKPSCDFYAMQERSLHHRGVNAHLPMASSLQRPTTE